MCAISTAVAIAERDGPRVSSLNHRQPPEDRGDWQNIHNLLARKGLVDQFGAALVDPSLCAIKKRVS